MEGDDNTSETRGAQVFGTQVVTETIVSVLSGGQPQDILSFSLQCLLLQDHHSISNNSDAYQFQDGVRGQRGTFIGVRNATIEWQVCSSQDNTTYSLKGENQTFSG